MRENTAGLPVAAPQLTIDAVNVIKGCAFGLRSPAAMICVSLSDPAHWCEVIAQAQRVLDPRLQLDLHGRSNKPSVADETTQFVQALGTMLRTLLNAAGAPALEAPRVLWRKHATGRQPLLLIPAPMPHALQPCVRWLVELLRKISAGAVSAERADTVAKELDNLIHQVGAAAGGGFNTSRFVQAAHELGVPWTALTGGVYQYGWGKRSLWLESTFTDRTSNISARLARNKVFANTMLRAAGIPVPLQRTVRTVEEALEAADRFGYPVVVKPADQDGGRGVSAGLGSPDQVRTAYGKALEYSSRVLLEKHVEGQDYRIVVFNGRAIWANARTPGGVTGDGVRSVRELVERMNADPLRGRHPWSPLKRVDIDDEAIELLALSSMALDSIPAEGQFVQLRRTASIARGGTPLGVFERMHPDNARLAERAARALRLDLAGVDLLIPDIERSWRETGAAICEVNGQPRMSVTAPHIHAQLLRDMIRGQGRIPIGLVLTTSADSDLVGAVTKILESKGLCVGVSTQTALTVGGHEVATNRMSTLDHARALLSDCSVDVVLVATNGAEFMASGLPFDRFDVLAVGDWNDPVRSASTPKLRQVLSFLQPHCKGRAMAHRSHALAEELGRAMGAAAPELCISMEQLAERLAKRLLARHELYERAPRVANR